MANSRLTDRERQILRLIGQGQSSRDIAHALSISLWTVSNHRKHICAKLNLHSTAELVAYAINLAVAGAPESCGAPCDLAIDFRAPGGRVRIAYQGHIRGRPAIVTLRIGKTTLYF